LLVAGFDPSLTHFGWVLLDPEKSGKETLCDFGVFKTDTKDGLRIQRIIMQRERLRKLLTDTGVRFVAMEAPYWDDYSTELLYALNQFIHEVFLDLGVFVIYIQPVSLKKFALPNMNPQMVEKHHMVHQAKTELEKHGKRFAEHVADAYFAAKVGARFYQWYFMHKLKDEDLTEEEHHLFCEKHTFTKGPRKGVTEYTGIIYRENDQFFDYSKQPLRRTSDIIKETNHGIQQEKG
jgi:Holliday junction resolvasome RuvABC endonuclease subunit